MKIKWGALVVNGSGKLGGHVASKNRGGNYLRTLVTPSNPQTQFQQAGRGVFTQLTQGWSGLSDAERETWNNATDSFTRTDAFGDVRELSGKGLYISLNKERELVGLPFISIAPSPGPIEVPTLPTAAFLVSGGELEIVPGVQADPYIVIKSSGVVSQGTSFVKNKLRTIATGLVSTSTDPGPLFDAYVARFGQPALGDKIFISVYTVNESGQRSPQITKVAEVVA